VAAAVITAVASLITALSILITAFTVFIPLLRHAKAVETKTEQVHVLVNSNHKAMLRREEVLIRALQKAGIDVPPDEAIVEPGTVSS